MGDITCQFTGMGDITMTCAVLFVPDYIHRMVEIMTSDFALQENVHFWAVNVYFVDFKSLC